MKHVFKITIISVLLSALTLLSYAERWDYAEKSSHMADAAGDEQQVLVSWQTNMVAEIFRRQSTNLNFVFNPRVNIISGGGTVSCAAVMIQRYVPVNAGYVQVSHLTAMVTPLTRSYYIYELHHIRI